jgi:hypothetical protein
MGKLLLILLLGGALANGIAPRAEPPLLIDSPTAAPATLDAAH